MSAAEWTPDLEIRPRQHSVWAELVEAWNYRELILYLGLSEIQGRYRRTVLGISWLIIKPTLNMIVLAIVFGGVLKVASDGVPYPLFLLAGATSWNFFLYSTTRAATSLKDNAHVISKVYFPRLAYPLACVLSGVVDFGASLLVLLAGLLIYRTPLQPQMLWLPVFLLAAVLPVLTASIWLAMLTARFPDLAQALTFIMQALMYAAPVVYSMELIPEQWRTIYWLNPLVGVIQGTRWALFGSGTLSIPLFIASLALCSCLLAAGVYFFQHVVRAVADNI